MLDKANLLRNPPKGGTLVEVGLDAVQPNPTPSSALSLNDSRQVGVIAPGAIARGKTGPAKTMRKAEYLSVMVEYEDKVLLEKLAKRRGVSVARLTRRALEDFLAPIRSKETS